MKIQINIYADEVYFKNTYDKLHKLKDKCHKFQDKIHKIKDTSIPIHFNYLSIYFKSYLII